LQAAAAGAAAVDLAEEQAVIGLVYRVKAAVEGHRPKPILAFSMEQTTR
jgi:hypothetical protein